MGMKRWQSRAGGVPETVVDQPPVGLPAMVEQPVSAIPAQLTMGEKLQTPSPEQVIAAQALGEAKRTDEVIDVRYDNLNKQVSNLRDDVEKLTARVLLLESTHNPSPIVPQQPTPAAPTPAPAVPVDANPSNPASAVVTDNPGSKVVTWDSGPHAGKVLRVEKGQSVDAFKAEYKLSDADWDFWKKNQLPLNRTEHSGNLTDPSWASLT